MQNNNLSSDLWIADSGASCHMTHNKSDMYDINPPLPCREAITVGGKRRLQDEYVGSVDINFHGFTDVRLTLTDVSYIPGLGVNLYSVLAASRTNLVIFYCLGARVIGTKITFPRNVNGSCLKATRLPAVTVGEKRKLDEVYAVDLLKRLDHPIPHLPVETRSGV